MNILDSFRQRAVELIWLYAKGYIFKCLAFFLMIVVLWRAPANDGKIYSATIFLTTTIIDMALLAPRLFNINKSKIFAAQIIYLFVLVVAVGYIFICVFPGTSGSGIDFTGLSSMIIPLPLFDPVFEGLVSVMENILRESDNNYESDKNKNGGA